MSDPEDCMAGYPAPSSVRAITLNDRDGEIAWVQTDGDSYDSYYDSFYDWSRIVALAAQWRPYCVDLGVNIAKLLVPLRPRLPPDGVVGDE